MREIVATLAADEMTGRDNLTPGSQMAQEYLIGQLQSFAEPFFDAEGSAGYTHEFADGVNLLAVVPGSDLADEVVVVGAHYDHVGSDCKGTTAADSICNGATDNATGVAAALTIGRALAESPTPPRRSVVIALWDAEEDGLVGSREFLAADLLPVSSIVGYVNFDIQGTSMSPALTGVTVMVGAETGGPNLVAAAAEATSSSALTTVPLSLLFGQGRSDHASFVDAGVPSVFFTDSTPPCYHSVGDDLSIVDFVKLTQQIATAQALTTTLANTDDVPVFDPAPPPATYDDAVSLLDIVSRAQVDFGLFSAEDRAAADQYLVDLQRITDAGAEAFDDAAAGTVLAGAVTMVGAWSTGECQAFLTEA